MKRILLASAISAVLCAAMAWGPADYVQDGLLAQFDGIDNAGTGTHDSSATTWKDLVTGVAATQAGNRTVTVGSNCYHFTDASSTIQETIGNFTATAAANGGFTIDYSASYSSVVLGIGFKMSGAGMYFQAGNLTYTVATGQCGGWKSVPANTFCTGAVVYDANCTPSAAIPYFNGVRTPAASVTWQANYLPGNTVTIGNLSGNVATGDVYAVRLYGRRLAAEEVLRNALIDRLRFVGTLPDGYRDNSGTLEKRVRVTNPEGIDLKVDGVAQEGDFEGWTELGTNATYTLTATPAEGYIFHRWTGDTQCITSGNHFSNTITVASTVAASFTPIYVAIPEPAMAEPVVEIDVSSTTVLDDWLAAHPDVTIGTTGTIVKKGTGTLQVTSDVIQSFAGEIVIEAGRWYTTTNTGLGVKSGGGAVWVKNGATLQMHSNRLVGQNESAQQFTRQVYATGTGFDGNGAIVGSCFKGNSDCYRTMPGKVELLGNTRISTYQKVNFDNMFVQLNRFTATVSPLHSDWVRFSGTWTNGNMIVTSNPLLFEGGLIGGAESVVRFKNPSGYRSNTYDGKWTAVFENGTYFYGPNAGTATWSGPIVLEGDTRFNAQGLWQPFVLKGPISGPGNLGKTTSLEKYNRIKISCPTNSFTGGIWLKKQSLEVTTNGAIPANGGALDSANSTVYLSGAMEYQLPDLALSGTGSVYSVANTTGSFKNVTKSGNSLITWNTKVGAKSFALNGGTLKFGAIPVADGAVGVDFGCFSASPGTTLDLGGNAWTCTNLTGAAALVDGALTVNGPWTLTAATVGTLGGGTATVAFGPNTELTLADASSFDRATVYTIATSATAFADKVPLSEETRRSTYWRVRLSSNARNQELYYASGSTLTFR